MKSICVFGVFVADLCFVGKKIPSKGQTVLGKKHVVGPGGKGSNQAIAAARLNGEVSFITKVGRDSHSEMAFNLYKEAISFSNEIADLAELEGHHPYIHINFKEVVIILFTHKINGLHENDFILASKCDLVFDKLLNNM